MNVYRVEHAQTGEFLGLYHAETHDEAKNKAGEEFGYPKDSKDLFVLLVWEDDNA